LILDEPTSGLDPLMQEEFLALVGEERERGCTVFVSSHDLDEVQRICDRVGMVREGRLIAVERMADLLGKAQRKVSVRLADPGSLEDLRALPGVSEFSVLDGRASFEVAGDFDHVLKALAAHHVIDIEAVHPSLEEVFLGYYREEGER
jgi:ABC-2 type transport system ATP-binding protein